VQLIAFANLIVLLTFVNYFWLSNVTIYFTHAVDSKGRGNIHKRLHYVAAINKIQPLGAAEKHHYFRLRHGKFHQPKKHLFYR
ncbi:hypothetical protein NPN23_24180, partial [Vibrio parahaemolyticus]|nr:hypothetical protein [Vibrio parahaemolyticus]